MAKGTVRMSAEEYRAKYGGGEDDGEVKPKGKNTRKHESERDEFNRAMQMWTSPEFRQSQKLERLIKLTQQYAPHMMADMLRAGAAIDYDVAAQRALLLARAVLKATGCDEPSFTKPKE